MKHFIIAISFFTALNASAQTTWRAGYALEPEAVTFSAENTPATKLINAASGMARLSPVTIATELCSKLQFKYAQLMDCEIESITNLSLFSFIEDWWGTRYRFGGSSKDGIDCSSFTGLLMQSVFNFSLPRTAAQQYAMCVKLTREEMAEGDLVFFNTRGGISHVGVYLGSDRFVHSSCSSGVTISSLNEAYYAKRFKGAGRITGDS